MVQLGRSARKKRDGEVNAAGQNDKASGLISSAVSLDGQSLQLPEEYLHSNVAASSFLGVAPSLDGESLLLPDDDSALGDDGGIASYMNVLSDPSGDDDDDDDDIDDGLDFQDDVSSINDESIAHPDPATVMNQKKKYLKIVGSGSGENTHKESDSEVPTNGGSTQKDSSSQQTPTKIAFATTTSSTNKSSKDSQQKPQEGSPGAGSARGCCCCPVWIRKAPTWLKIVFAISLVLLLAAMALVGVGLTMAVRNKQQSNAATENGVGPTSNGTLTPPGSERVTVAPSPSIPTSTNTAAPTAASIPGITTNVTDGAGNGIEIPLDNATNAEQLLFYVTGGRFPGDIMSSAPELLSTIPASQDAFMVHLGDWNAPSVSGCVSQDYDNVDKLFENSAVPVYFVVGDNEYNDCSDQDEALSMWRDSLDDYETEYWPDPTWEVLRQDVREENFAFYNQETIFVGINLVAGSVISADEWVARHDDDLSWIDENFAKYSKEGAKALVLFGHAAPDHAPNAAFFSQLFDRIQSTYADIHFVFVHRNTPQQTTEITRQFNDIPNLDVVVVQGSVWPPMKITLDFSGNAVKVAGDQTLWYENL